MKTNRLLLFLFLSISINFYSQRIREVNDFLAGFSGTPGGDNNESIIFEDKLFFTVGTSKSASANSIYYTRFHYTDGDSQFQIKYAPGNLSRYFQGELSSANYTVFQNQLFFTGKREDQNNNEKYRLAYGPEDLNGFPGYYHKFVAEAGVFTDVEVLNNTTLYFGGWVDTANIELHKFVRPIGGTGVVTRVTDINTSGSSEIKNLIAFNDAMYFSAFDGTKQELYFIDTNDTITKVTITGETIEDPEELTIVNNKLYFSANDGIGRKLYVIDPSKVNPIIKFDFLTDDASPNDLTPFEVLINGVPKKLLVMSAFYGSNGKELVIVDSASNINAVSSIDIKDNGDSDPQKFYQFNDNLFFSAVKNAGRELYKFDGTNFSPVANINPSSGNSNPNFFMEFEGKLYFNAVTFSEGSELWQLDENDNLSIVESHLLNSTNSFNPRPMADFLGKLYVSGYKVNTERELYVLGLETKILSTADSNWENESNWDFGTPNEFVNAIIAEDVSLDINNYADTKDLVVTSSLARINIQPSGALNVEGNATFLSNKTGVLNLFSNNQNEYGTFICEGTYTGDKIKYNKYLTDSKQLSGSPLEDVAVSTMVSNLEDLGNGIVGIGFYNNSFSGSSGLEYYTAANANTLILEEGKGYAIDRNGAGLLTFEGLPNQNDVSVNITKGTKNGWNLLSNPYTSYISAVDLNSISVNRGSSLLGVSNPAIDSQFYAIYYYDTTMNKGRGGFNAINLTNTYANLPPGKAFFIKSNGTSGNFNMKLDATNHNLDEFINANRLVTLYMENDIDATQISSTKIIYASQDNFTARYDAARFNLEEDEDFFIATKLVIDNAPEVGLDYQIQGLSGSMNQIIPISLTAKAGTVFDFTMEKENFPSNIDVYIEDRENNTFHKLETSVDSFPVTLTNDLNGAGRFYLHTANQTPLSTNDYDIDETIYAYSVDNKIIINGLNGLENSITVFDVLGKKVAEVAKNIENKIEIIVNSKLTKGVYFVNIKTNKKVISKKVLLK